VSQKREGGGQNAGREIEREIESRTGHPTSAGGQEGNTGAAETNGQLADEFLGVSPRSHQHARKGQAESPRELTLNQPEPKHHKNP
jgi:hypothetical protein